MSAAPAPRKRRTRNRKQQLDLSSSSGSDSSDESEAAPEPPVNGQEAAETDSGDDSSSLGIASSDDEDGPTQKRTRGGAAAHAPVLAPAIPEVNGQVIKPLVVRKNKQRSPSPPLFGFSELSSTDNKPFLHGHVKGDRAETTVDAETTAKFEAEQKLIRQWYIERVVGTFGKELDSLKQESGVQKRLDLLIKSLNAGADHFSSTNANLPPDMAMWLAKAKVGESKVGDREVLLEAISAKQSTATEDVEMED